jgi:hypothetical protein
MISGYNRNLLKPYGASSLAKWSMDHKIRPTAQRLCGMHESIKS